MEKRLTYLQAIRKHCLWCCCDSAPEVRECESTDCALHPYRMGHYPEVKPDKSPLKSIRDYCKDCAVEGIPRLCDDSKCELHEYRMGHNPGLKGKRKNNLSSSRNSRTKELCEELQAENPSVSENHI